ncbi:MAG: L,D-transpeptidase family protein [Gammaproteobacteria bacterium]|nr:L,D-transpeptidase family protein [Gammaproteobacteria bacterium]
MKLLSAFFLMLFFSPLALALVYHFPDTNDDLIGQIKITQAQPGQYLYDVARENEMGFDALVKTNPKVPRYSTFKKSYLLTIPSLFILPIAPRKGIVINIAEKRLYYYPEDDNVVITEPIAVGKPYWSTPLINTYVLEKLIDPVWVVPESIKEYSALKGKILPDVMPAGDENPLGKYALRLADWSLLIHGTNQPELIGKRVSSGCIRMYPEDIEYLYAIVPLKTPVMIVNQPYKLGWKQNRLYLEVHPAFVEFSGTQTDEENLIHEMIMAFTESENVHIDWQAVYKTVKDQTGLPHQIGDVTFGV